MVNQTTDRLVKNLIESGLTLNQTLVYLANLKLGPASIWDISKTSTVKRTTCYVVMNELITKGYASVTYDSKRSIYTVISPNELFFQLLNRQEAMRQLVPELNALASQSPIKPIIRMYEGVEGMEQAYQLPLNLRPDSEILIYGNPEVYSNYPEMVDQYVRERVARKIHVRTIIPDIPLGFEVTKNDAEILRQTRVLSKNQFDQKTEVNILPSSILYLAHSEKKPFATVIESQTLAREEKSRFELLWNIAKPIR